MLKAFFLDFYGTVVHEDGAVIEKITEIIARTGNTQDRSEIDSFWWKDFQELFLHSAGDTFETQRALETRSLEHTLRRFGSDEDAAALSSRMFAHWVQPPIFGDAKEFFERSPLPVYIVSNIDTADVMAAIRYHDLHPAGVFTSENARAYKPAKELFRYALRKTGLHADEVLHIGDSLGSDVRGAQSVGIRALWIDRSGREIPDDVTGIRSLPEALDVIRPR